MDNDLKCIYNEMSIDCCYAYSFGAMSGYFSHIDIILAENCPPSEKMERIRVVLSRADAIIRAMNDSKRMSQRNLTAAYDGFTGVEAERVMDERYAEQLEAARHAKNTPSPMEWIAMNEGDANNDLWRRRQI